MQLKLALVACLAWTALLMAQTASRTDGTAFSIPSCTASQKLMYNTGTNEFYCDTDSTGGGGFPTATLATDAESTSSSTYTTIFTVALSASTTHVVHGILAQSTSATTVGIQTRGRVTQSGWTGFCNFERQSSATANGNIDNIAVGTNPADTAQTAEFNAAVAPTRVNCTVTTDGNAGDLVLEFQSETGASVKTLEGSWYSLVSG